MSVKIEGVETVVAQIEAVRAGKHRLAALAAIGVDFVGRVSPYPPPPAGSTYRRGQDKRSETLGRRWSIESANGGEQIIIINSASYARWVHDRDYQVAVHTATGWRTWQTEAEKAAPEYEALMKAYTEAALQGGV